MTDLSYAEEKLRNAVEALATSKAPIRERLMRAALEIVTLTPDDFEDDTDRIAIAGLSGMTSRLAEMDKDLAAGTARPMREGEAVATARAIFGLYVRVSQSR